MSTAVLQPTLPLSDEHCQEEAGLPLRQPSADLLLSMSPHRLPTRSIQLIRGLESSIVQCVAAIYPNIFIVKVSIR